MLGVQRLSQEGVASTANGTVNQKVSNNAQNDFIGRTHYFSHREIQMDEESQLVKKVDEKPPRWMTYLPLLSLLVGLCAFGFQVFVL